VTGGQDSDRSRVLLDASREGDTSAYAEFIQMHERRVSSIVGRILDDARDVDEVTQDTFVQIWRALPQFRGDAAVTTWIYRIATNAALMRARRRRIPQVTFEAVGELAWLGGTDATTVDVERRRRIAAVRAALTQLPVEQRAAVALRDIEGLSTAEAAEVLGVAEPALKTRLHRGRMRLRSLLAEHADSRRE
jgi:RNA polymerase sigma-70 factor (ECF subfamily)